jgi:hypothetical protein
VFFSLVRSRNCDAKFVHFFSFRLATRAKTMMRCVAAKGRTLVYILRQHFMVNEFFKQEIREKSSLPSLKAGRCV